VSQQTFGSSQDDAQRIEDPRTTEQQLRAAACRVVRMEEGDGAFDEMASKLFQIDAAHREPCPEPEK